MKELLVDLLESNRHQRHDFLNHLQVVWGFMKLNRSDKAIEYIQKVTNYLQSLRDLNNIASPELAAEISVKVLEIGFRDNFAISIPEFWEIKEIHVAKIRGLLDEVWEILKNKIIFEETSVKIHFVNGKIIISTDGIIEWERIEHLSRVYNLGCKVEKGQVIIFAEE